MKITFISDTHGKHNQITKDLPGGDLLIHAGDFMNSGYYEQEATDFFGWFDKVDNYDAKIFIAGNHDRLMENDPTRIQGLLTGYKWIDYIQDDNLTLYFDGPNGDFPEDNIHIYGSPWQPEFHNWAFNLPRNSDIMKEKWDAIPNNTDILITHGPPLDELRPKIHVFGHIHGSAGYYFNGHTHFINASVLNERYIYSNLPLTFEWDKDTNEIKWL